MNKIKLSSYIIMTLFLVMCFTMHLMPTLIAGTVVFILISKLYNFVSPKVQNQTAKKITLTVVALAVVILMTSLVAGIYYAIKSGHSNTQALVEHAGVVLEQLKKYLPESLLNYIPEDVLALKEKVLEIAKSESPHIFEATTHSLKAFVHIILGIILGAVTAFPFLGVDKEQLCCKPLTSELMNRFKNFKDVFERVIFAQGKISAINTFFTAIYLLIILPIFSIDIPYAKVLVILTFCVGLIPVLGNLISNTFIVLMSLTVSFEAAVFSLLFLVIIHKLEYYVNAKIVGSKIKTSIWELLIAMILMETIFGLLGVALAPVIYGYIKLELQQLELV